MGREQRIKLYGELEEQRSRPLIVYVTSKRPGVAASMATDALPYLIEQLDQLPPKAEKLDLLIASLGGDPMVAWRMMSLIRERVSDVAVLIPQSAYSAATLLALGANEIVIHPNGNLGPVDMQITTFSGERPRQFSTEDISAFIEFVREHLSITDQEHLRQLFEVTCKEVGTLGVGFTARSSKLAVALGEKLLGMHSSSDDDAVKSRALLESLSREFHSHAYPVSRSEAKEIGLQVNEKRDEKVEDLMWSIWLDLEDELRERVPASPIVELMNSPQAEKLLRPVLQFIMPFNVPAPSYIQTDLDKVLADKNLEKVEPVDFEHVDSLMESKQLCFRGVTKGKLLATRLPDLTVQYNALTTFRGWERREPENN